MTDAGLRFESVRYDIEESYPSDIAVCDVPLYLAKLKSEGYPYALEPKDIIITADTVVIAGGEILGKPKDRDAAREMLRRLSGSEHQVTTGVYLRSKGVSHGFSVDTKVWFRALSDQEIEYYVDTFNPFDKAGSYGIQEWIGYVGVEKIEGSFYNVMGLPVQRLYCELGDMIKNRG